MLFLCLFLILEYDECTDSQRHLSLNPDILVALLKTDALIVSEQTGLPKHLRPQQQKRRAQPSGISLILISTKSL